MHATATTGSGRKLRADAQRNYDALVAVARDAFAEHGADASLDEIAKRAGVGPGTLYRHFPTRADLQLAVLADWIADVDAEGDRLAAVEDAEQALSEWLHRYLEYKNFFRGLHEALLEIPVEQDRSALTVCKAKLTSISEQVVDRAKAAGLVRDEVEARTICQLVSGIAFLVDRAPAGTVDVDAQLAIIRAGIRPGS